MSGNLQKEKLRNIKMTDDRLHSHFQQLENNHSRCRPGVNLVLVHNKLAASAARGAAVPEPR